MLQHTQEYLQSNRGFVALVTLLMVSQATLLAILSTSYALSLRNDLLLTKQYRLTATFGLDSCLAWAVGKMREDRKFETTDSSPYFNDHQCIVTATDMTNTDSPTPPGSISKFISIKNKFKKVEISKDVWAHIDSAGNLIIL